MNTSGLAPHTGQLFNAVAKMKHLYAMLSNGQRFAADEHFQQLSPIYDVSVSDIEAFIKSKL